MQTAGWSLSHSIHQESVVLPRIWLFFIPPQGHPNCPVATMLSVHFPILLPRREGLETYGLAGGKPLRTPGIEHWEVRHSHCPAIHGDLQITGEALKVKGWTDGPWGKKQNMTSQL